MEKEKRIYDDKHFYLGDLDYSDFLDGYYSDSDGLRIVLNLESYSDDNKYLAAIKKINIGEQYFYKYSTYSYLQYKIMSSGTAWIGDTPDVSDPIYTHVVLFFEKVRK